MLWVRERSPKTPKFIGSHASPASAWPCLPCARRPCPWYASTARLRGHAGCIPARAVRSRGCTERLPHRAAGSHGRAERLPARAADYGWRRGPPPSTRRTPPWSRRWPRRPPPWVRRWPCRPLGAPPPGVCGGEGRDGKIWGAGLVTLVVTAPLLLDSKGILVFSGSLAHTFNGTS